MKWIAGFSSKWLFVMMALADSRSILILHFEFSTARTGNCTTTAARSQAYTGGKDLPSLQKFVQDTWAP